MPRAARAPQGCGIDVVDVARFQRAVTRQGERFLRRVFTERERAYARARRQAVLHLAARFAAKEAVIKALSQVQPELRLSMRQIEVRNDALGRPSVRINHPGTRAVVSVSLSHVDGVAAAMAIASAPAAARARTARRR